MNLRANVTLQSLTGNFTKLVLQAEQGINQPAAYQSAICNPQSAILLCSLVGLIFAEIENRSADMRHAKWQS
jgi:hypothetical protein